MTELDEPNFIQFLPEIYRNQYDQRWRSSRNQDWTLLGAVVTLIGVSTVFVLENWFLHYALLGLPIAAIFLSFVGLGVLRKHQIVMDHAVHIATGIERYFAIVQSNTEAISGNEELFVGVRSGAFVYPSKDTFKKNKEENYRPLKFLKNIFTAFNVQSAMGLVYLIAICSQILLILRFVDEKLLSVCICFG